MGLIIREFTIGRKWRIYRPVWYMPINWSAMNELDFCLPDNVKVFLGFVFGPEQSITVFWSLRDAYSRAALKSPHMTLGYQLSQIVFNTELNKSNLSSGN